MSENVKVTREQLAEVIGGLADAFRREAEMEHAETCAKYIEEHGETLLNPEHFHLFVTYDSEQMQEVLISNLLRTEQLAKEVGYTKEQMYALESLYLNYKTIEAQLKTLILKYEGHGCSTDKTRHILRMYRQSIITGKYPTFEDHKGYWTPEMGTSEAWLDFTKSVPSFLSGYVDDYFEKRAILVAQLEKEVSDMKEKQHEAMTNSPYYLGNEQKTNQFDKVEQVYAFANEKELLTIHQKENGEWGYILLVDGKRYGYKEKDEGLFPQWVLNLFESLR
ncbi:hypothetical protein JMA_37460 (plasmid) [Jeotgalibacillus malaysiensis]|uniref:Uncharacterized protein n=1 Tax=Jeotgalibacillus malaysiensis TaxID=1508404 RepID=A0A0B5AYI5_9BACL|nr:hypothetical protein [Jeotgalibacillus malaysiensis]AJD93064.1 hypothetical protein JMA_37460 [Jeotgalibacillus malaysiensis]